MADLMDLAAVGRLLGVEPATVSRWIRRYQRSDTPCPEPDGRVGKSPYWRPERAEEWRRWHANRPGQGWRKTRD